MKFREAGSTVVPNIKALTASATTSTTTTTSTNSSSATDPVETLETQMMILVRNFTLLARRHGDEWGMDRAGYLLLRTLEQIGPASINVLADTLGLDGSTVTRQISSMQAAELVVRETNPEDRRSCIIRPTEDGVERMNQFRERRKATVTALTNSWSTHERRTLSKMLSKLNDSIVTHAEGRETTPKAKKRRARSRHFRTA